MADPIPRRLSSASAPGRRALSLALVAFGLPALLFVTRVASADMRCDGRLVSPGDTKAELLLRCGEPTTQSIVGVIRATDDGSRVLTAYVDEWSYPSAGTEPFRLLRFEAGQLVGEGIRCDGGLVRTGDTAAGVLEVCGRPVSRDSAATRDLPAAPGRSPDGASPTDRAEILVLQWVYEMGEGQFAKIVTLEGGRITQIVDGRRR